MTITPLVNSLFNNTPFISSSLFNNTPLISSKANQNSNLLLKTSEKTIGEMENIQLLNSPIITHVKA